jgi:hypothetical protein
VNEVVPVNSFVRSGPRVDEEEVWVHEADIGFDGSVSENWRELTRVSS